MDDLLKYWILRITKALLWVIETVSDPILGRTFTGGTKEERRKAENYENSAQVVTVVHKAKETLYKWTTIDNFLYKHEKYVNPNYVLKNKNSYLLGVEKDYALFGMTKDPNIDIYNTKDFPFLLIFQYTMAEKLVIMPIESFHRLANELGDPKVPVAITAMTARCGSTLLAQVFNRVPGTRSMSEPWATCNIHNLRARGKISHNESRKLLKSAIRLHCKVEPGSGVERIFMKMTPMNAPQFGDLGELFPKIHFFFNTRHPIPSIKSIKQVIDTILHTDQPYYYSWGISWWDQIALNSNFPYGNKYDHILKRFNKWRQNVPEDEFSVINYASTMAAFFETKNMYDRVILYENLSSNPETEVKEIFKIMGIDEKNVPLALEALKRDSQNGTFGKRGEGRSLKLDPWLLDKFDEYMKMAFMPQFHQNMTVPEFKEVFGL